MSTSSQQRRLLLHSGLALGLGLTLMQPRRAQACEFFLPTLRVTHPWTRASGPDASSAIVSLKIDEVNQADRLIAVETPVAARAAIGGVGARPSVDLPIAAGAELLLGEEGTYIELLDLQHPLFIARSYPLRLHFEKGGALDASLSVDYLPRGAGG